MKNIWKSSPAPDMPRHYSSEIAFVSFAIGTVLMAIRMEFDCKQDFMVLGFFYVVFAAFINGMVLFHLCILFVFRKKYRAYYFCKMLIVLANIPIAAIYCYIVFSKKNLFNDTF